MSSFATQAIEFRNPISKPGDRMISAPSGAFLFEKLLRWRIDQINAMLATLMFEW